MPVFVEDPAHLSKSRLKSDLVAHNVELPPGKSKKEVYVQLHLKHIDQKNAADFSSDEEDRVQDVADEREKPEDAEMPDPSGLTDDDLKAALLVHGVKAGPIVASTRALYERKLSKLLQSDGHYQLNGAEKGILYSDSEEEEENGEEEDAESGAEKEKQTVEQSDQGQQESSQCFLPSSRLHARPTRKGEPSVKWNSGNALKSSEPSGSRWSQIPAGISRASSVDQRSGLGSGVPSGSQLVMASSCSSSSSQTFSITEMVEEMESQRSLSTRTNTERELKWSNVQEHWSRSNRLDVPVVDKCTMTNQSVYYTPGASPHEWGMKLPQEPVKDTFKDIFSNAETTPTGIYATRRRPIKGAAGRPVQYAYPDTAVSPTTLERREVERRLVPILIQVLVFLIVVCVLYLIYVCLWDTSFSPFVALLDSLNQMSDSEEGLLLQTEVQDTPAPSGQE
ncbi:LEM domain-containing protein 1 isoform X2 [Seriola aureovittata]|uniref:LEM domain-containing protein 1 isoform X2 n=1 Tax=Seriola aureovittata TaxID=2871759 RepID=UPI0024BE89C1|nr:LEM domain-containing protein 1 isoform X2 [Seriola aureovittata]